MTDLLSRLPKVRGDYNSRAALAQHTWFGVGGPVPCVTLTNPLRNFGSGAPCAEW